jgi:hypothetical protein
MEDTIEEILKKIEELERHYNECSNQALDKGNINAAQLHAAEASAFDRAMWIIEDVAFNKKKEIVNMRDTNRIEPFLAKLGEYWKKVPDWRFGQLMVNFLGQLERDPFFYEENELLEEMEKYFRKPKDGWIR